MCDPVRLAAANLLAICLTMVVSSTNLLAADLPADWPAWRGDAARTAVTEDKLPAEPKLAWSVEQAPNHIAWQEDERIQFDASHQPIVAGGKVLIASSTTDSITAYDAQSGERVWRTFADGPIRFAPVVKDERVYFGSDDGCFYALSLQDGKEVWKFSAAPTQRRVLGNERLISVWPVRGGPVLHHDKIYFTAGVWPFEGALLYIVDLKASDKEPVFYSQVLEDVSPQGYLVVENDRLYIPGGRAKATCVDLKTGKRVSLAYDSRGHTDYHVATGGNLLFHGKAVYDIAGNKLLRVSASRPVADDKLLFTGSTGAVVAYDLVNRKVEEEKDRRGNVVKTERIDAAWAFPTTEIAGGVAKTWLSTPNHVVCSLGKELFAVYYSAEKPTLAWKLTLEEEPGSVVAAGGRIFVSVPSGKLLCFDGKGGGKAVKPTAVAAEMLADGDRLKGLIDGVVTENQGGYFVLLGAGDGKFARELAGKEMRTIVIEPDAAKANALKGWALDQGHYGINFAVLQDDPTSAELPPYLAHVIMDYQPELKDWTPTTLSRLYRSVRPYGGSLVALAPEGLPREFATLFEAADAKDTQASAMISPSLVALKREGALPGSADWTHEYGDSANTLMSQDDLVMAPLGVLWYGGPAGSGELFYNRHYWGPGLTVIGGRMFVQGPERLAAIDIYTGRVLWKKEIRDGSGNGRRGNFFERAKPGFHFVAVEDAVYLVYDDECQVLDPKTGETTKSLKFENKDEEWGKVRVWKNLLIAAVFKETEDYGKLPKYIRGIDRHTGKTVWTHECKMAAPIVAVGPDKVYYFDGVMTDFYDAWKRKGNVPAALDFRYLRALDAATGKQEWETTTDRIVTWLAYSKEHDTVVTSNKQGLDAFQGKDGKELWKKHEVAPGFGGHPENVWDKVILSGDEIIDQRGPGKAYSIKDGSAITNLHPLTGETVDWEFTKTGHHCNYAIASPHLLTFRAASAGFFDRETGGTGRLDGFRSGCRNSLIPAGGVLNAPNYAHGCICSYNLFTSLALVHTPENELWTYNALDKPAVAPKRLGINFGAPGDRLDDEGTLWMEFPSRRDPSVTVPVTVEPAGVAIFRNLSTGVAAEDHSWVAASGVEGITKLSIGLAGAKDGAKYTAKLYFAEPHAVNVTRGRTFSVAAGGDGDITDLNVAKSAGGEKKLIVELIKSVPVKDGKVTFEFTPTEGKAIISGVELIAE